MDNSKEQPMEKTPLTKLISDCSPEVVADLFEISVDKAKEFINHINKRENEKARL